MIILTMQNKILLIWTILTFLSRTCNGYPALVYSDLSQPSPSKLQVPPTNFQGNIGRKFTMILNIFSPSDLSFCFWIKLDNLRRGDLLKYELKNKQGFGFALQQQYGFLNLKNVDLLFDYNFYHVPKR